MINRAAVILKYKEPAVKWINDADPGCDDPGIKIESVNEERIVYLITDEDADTRDLLRQWIETNYAALFESELAGWYTDENLWPGERNLKLFDEWFEIECHTVIEDTVGSPIEDDDEHPSR